MKTNVLKISVLALIAMFFFTSCDKDDDTKGKEPEGTVLKGTITENTVLKKNKTFTLDGEYIVKAGATLSIEEGVTIVARHDDKVDFILIEQGGKINAVGTASAPIVMTSEKKKEGAWGGIHICGYAPTNVEGGAGVSEIGAAPYGGNKIDDNSGVLKYVRVEYTGFAFNPEQESNGITFYGVGNGTVVENCEAYHGSDDGFEFFGGTVNIKNMVVVNCSDDSFDWTEGWSGTGENLVAFQAPVSEIGYDCDCLIEADNNEKNHSATPVSHPVLKNLILVGNNSAENKRGIRLRRGTQVKIENAKVCGKSKALAVESELTENALKDGISVLKNVSITGKLDSKEGIYTNAMFIAGNGNKAEQTITYTSLKDIEKDCPWMKGWTK